MMLPTDNTLRELLLSAKTIAVVGAKDAPGLAVDRVGRFLLSQGYEVIPVHHKRDTVWGLPAVRSLDRVERADIVVVFRAAEHCAGNAREFLAMKERPSCFWMQEGIRSFEARNMLVQANVFVVQDRCIKTTHEKLLPGGPYA